MTKKIPGIDQLPSGHYRVRVQKRGQPVNEIVETLQEAIDLRDAIRSEITVGELQPVEGVSALDWGDIWLRDFRRQNRGYNSECGRFQSHIATAPWAKTPLRAVQSPDIMQWLIALSKKKAVRNGKVQKKTLGFQTRKHIFNLARSLFSDAMSLGYCTSNPCIGVKVKKTTSDRNLEHIPEEWPFKPAEQAKMLEAIRDDPERWIMLFCMGTGLRQGEAWNLHLEDVHTEGDDPHVYVRFGSLGKAPKNGRAEPVPLFGIGLLAAREWLKVLPSYAKRNPHKLMFPTPTIEKRKGSTGRRGFKGGDRRQSSKTPKSWTRAKDALGTNRKSWWHLLRHTCATSLLCGWWGKAWSLSEVSKLLRHSSTKVTERYAHLMRGNLTKVAAETDALFIIANGLQKTPDTKPRDDDEGSSGGSSGAPRGGSSGNTNGSSGDTNGSSTGAISGTSSERSSCHAVVMAEIGKREIEPNLPCTPEKIRTSDRRLRRHKYSEQDHGVKSFHDNGVTTFEKLAWKITQALANNSDDEAWEAAQALAKAVLEDRANVLAKAVLMAGPFAMRRAVELAEMFTVFEAEATGVGNLASRLRHE